VLETKRQASPTKTVREVKMVEKMSKSNETEPNIDFSDEVKSLKNRIVGLESEVKYWKLRHSLLEKYGDKSK
jgi:hypothetical protein